MGYKRKTEDEWAIIGHYAAGAEEVTCEITRKAAKENLKAYRENEPGVSFTLKKRRVRIEPAEPSKRPRATRLKPFGYYSNIAKLGGIR